MEEHRERNEELKRPWDTCREVPVIEDAQTPWKMIKLLRIISLIAVAIFVFGLALCSKTSFLLLVTLSHEDTKTLSSEQKPLSLLCIGCSLVAPSVLLLLKSIWKACYKSSKMPRKSTIALVLFIELLVSLGVAVLTIVAMPHLDIVTNAAILNGVAVISSFLQVVVQCAARKINCFLLPPAIALILIVLGYALFVLLYVWKDPSDVGMALWVGLAVGASILVSFNWWENYFQLICDNRSNFLKNLFKDMTKCQNVLHILCSLLRVLVTACVLGAYVPLAKMDWKVVTSIPSRETRVVVIIVGVQLISSVLCHWFALVACKMHALRRCFVLPLYLASLAVMALLITPVIVNHQDFRTSLNTTENISFTGYCGEVVELRNQTLKDSVFTHLVYDVTQTLCFLDMSDITDIGLLTGAAASWWIGLVLSTLYICNLTVYRIQKTQDLFVRRLYEGAFIEQSLLLNTRFQIQTKDKSHRLKEIANDAMIYLCATMWHETNEEMMNIIISIFRLDKYRPKAEETKDFTFEAHIYFDDAFESVEGSPGRRLNEYAKSLVLIITEVYGIFENIDKKVFQTQSQIPEQSLIRTPYGGRLVVTMPHGNNLIVHYKDKDLIRHKKRWSQVMYLYYLLGWKLMTKYYRRMQAREDEETLREEIQKEKRNTYLLALDGDTDFQPAAVMLLIDRLKMYTRVGAACGRIHPTGSGPIVWFQKFEYAVSHWLQKTAEHVYGCVLCSPGCFSLFRAEALMDDNVMKTYSNKSIKASHCIQYDQGEDRWLCTLLLKQGWRVEYNAASDAYTNAPEDFKELYNQRRRWGPSTMANVVDLLGSSTVLSKRNPSISKPFMLYQLFAIISGVLAPATICLMVAGSLSLLLKIPSAEALILSVIPPTIYLGLCFKLKPDTQITIAAVLSALYALLMLLVTASIIGSMAKEENILTPSSVFIIAMSIIYVFTAMMHPQEVSLVFYGFLYILCIPSAYLLLTIYSMVNMNCVSWGTREVKPAAGAAAAPPQAPEQKSKPHAFFFPFLLWFWHESSLRPSQTSEDGRESVNAEPTQGGPQPQNSIVDDIAQDEQGYMFELTAFVLQEEENFWKDFQEKYLLPLPNDKEKQKQMHDELRQLRNRISFSFFFINLLWLVTAFIFQVLNVLPIRINLVNFDLTETGETFQIEPTGFMFILGFALSVLLQFLGMFYHRVSTLIHYVAFLNTELRQQKDKEKTPLQVLAFLFDISL
ncbi:unnamed protein product [Menidia menidia]|uniref:chitin synthase n=1 Tax=Menidia menidia TaxID=238744 RepID=A0A8S4AY84_9TELE|nr:unnamed protein product [Menidia menidia]